MRRIRTYHEVDHASGSELLEQVLAQRQRLADRLARVGTVLAVVSGKGGVGKSAVSANLAVALAARGLRVGAVDADLNGPSLARMLGASGGHMEDGREGVRPARGTAGVGVVSMELLQDAPDAPLRWTGPREGRSLRQSTVETGVLREFLSDVAWGELDVLVVDVPPGTDKIDRLLELVPDLPVALLVTTPSEMARTVAARSARQLAEAGVPAVGVVVNMAAHRCPECGHRTPLFPGDGGSRLAREAGLDVWAELPFDPDFGADTDRGNAPGASPETPAGPPVAALAERVRRLVRDRGSDGEEARR